MITVLPPGAGQIDVVLTNYVRGFQIPNGIADIVCPRVPSGSQTVSYLNDDGDDALVQNAQLLRAPGARAAEVGQTAPTLSPKLFLPSRALETPIPDEDQKAFKFGDLAQRAAVRNQKRIMTDREIRVGALLQDPTKYPAANTTPLSGNSQIDSALADPVQLAEQAKQQVGLYAEVNAVIISNNVASALRVNKNVRAAYTGVAPQVGLTDAMLAQVLGVEQVIIAKSIQLVNGARGRIWKNTMIFANIQLSNGGFTYLDPMTGLSSLDPLDSSFAKTFVWTDAPQTINGYGVTTQRAPYASQKANIVSNDWYGNEWITSGASAYLYTNCLANNF